MSGRRRLRLWLRWGVRDVHARRGQVLSIALLLALGVGMYSAMSSMSIWRVRSADASFAALRMHDLRVALVQGATAPDGTLRAVLAGSGVRTMSQPQPSGWSSAPRSTRRFARQPPSGAASAA